MKIATLAIAAITLSACGTTDYIGTQPVAFAHGGQDFRVYDMPAENRMMITPSLADARIWRDREPRMFGDELEFADAAQAFIQSRGCQVTNAKLLIEPQFEVTYSC